MQLPEDVWEVDAEPVLENQTHLLLLSRSIVILVGR